MTDGRSIIGVPDEGGPLVFVDDLDRPHLADADHHHLARVRRVRDGDAVIVADGRGGWRRARFRGHEPEPVDAVQAVPAPEPPLAVAFALVKGTKPDLVVQKLTELGIDRIIPFEATRSVVRWDPAKAGAAHERLVRIAREAAMQSRRAWLPTIEPVAGFAEVASRPGAVVADRGGVPIDASHRLVLVGPEGGWSDDERAQGLPAVALGDAVLRAETAAIAAGVLLGAYRLSG